MKTLLVDGTNILMRSLKAAQGSHMALSNADGVPTSALTIFINSLSKYVRQVAPDSMVVCWDGGRSEYRVAIYDGYKADRHHAPDDEKDTAFALAKEFLALSGIHQAERKGYEADDLIAYYWKMLGPFANDVVILSGDKDMLQLVSARVTQIRPDPQADDEVWDVVRVLEKFGCHPAFYGLVLALMGDKSDGIPGVPRVGLKTAVKDLSAADWNIEALIESGPSRYAEHAEVIRRNINLVELRSHRPPGLLLEPPPKVAFTDPGSLLWPDLLDFLARYELNMAKYHLIEGSLWG